MKKPYNVFYAVVMLSIILYLVIANDYTDMLFMVLAAIALILTSIFTYSNRK